LPWTFEPKSGYFNPLYSTPALSSVPASWPASWPDHPEWGTGVWHGVYGPGFMAGNQETFFALDDANDLRFNYAVNNARGIAFKPDSTDSTKTGQGIRLKVWYILSAEPLFRDIMFRVFDITNVSSYRYSKVVFGNLTGTYIGVTGNYDFGEWDDDAAVYFSSNDFTLAWDFPNNNSRNPYWVGQVGKFGEAFLEAPGSGRISNYNGFAPSSTLPLGDDERLWSMLTPGVYTNPASVIHDTVATQGEDMDYIYGSDYFSLDTGETRRIASVFSYGYTKDQVLQRVFLAKALWNSRFNMDSLTAAVTLTSLSGHTVVHGTQPITWSSLRSGGTVDIWFSPDDGVSWLPVVKNLANTGSYSWNTLPYTDCAFGILRIYIADPSGKMYGVTQTTGYLSVDNTPTAVPFVEILNKRMSGGQLITQPDMDLQMLLGDSKGERLSVELAYSVAGSGTGQIFDTYGAQFDSVPQIHTVKISPLPNSDHFRIKVAVTSGLATAEDSTDEFRKETPRAVVGSQNYQKISGYADVAAEVHIVDSSAVKPDTYIITFDDTSSLTQKTFTVFDLTQAAYLFQKVPFYPGIESRPFDGLALAADDFNTMTDTARSRWNRPVTYQREAVLDVANFPFTQPPVTGYAKPDDYMVVFSDTVTDTSVALTVIPFDGAIPLTFTVYDLLSGKRMKVATTDGWPKDVLFLETIGGRSKITWDLALYFTPVDSMPHQGDTLLLYTKKGLSIYDSLRISGLVLGVGPENVLPGSFRLSQNYPNPFNPSTRISYEVPVMARVALEVYNLLGQKVAVLADGVESAGIRSVEWDARCAASGVYFLKFEATPLSDPAKHTQVVRKMIVIR
jgi:hypothetical protein